MSTIELQTLTGPEIDGCPARGGCRKIAKWLSARLTPYRHLSGHRPEPLSRHRFRRRMMIDIGAASCCLPPIRSFLRWIFHADETTVSPHQTRPTMTAAFLSHIDGELAGLKSAGLYKSE
ncbi:hypothetical protein EN918_29430, partial [Mesorhizobium sp. M7A.F.Ca.CA.004.05.1.1]